MVLGQDNHMYVRKKSPEIGLNELVLPLCRGIGVNKLPGEDAYSMDASMSE